MKVIVILVTVLVATFTYLQLNSKPVLYVREKPVEIVPDDVSVKGVKKIIQEKAQKYNLSSKMMDEIILCESTYNPKAVHDHNSGVGVTGFHRDTFALWLKKYTKETKQNLNYDSTYDQLELMSWAFTKGESYRDDWSSYNRYKKYGTCRVDKIKLAIK